jgi:alcohol dehydrogenase class IV
VIDSCFLQLFDSKLTPLQAGTGSEATGVAIFDYAAMNAKTGIASRLLKPHLGIVDPDNTRSLPPQVAAARYERKCAPEC